MFKSAQKNTTLGITMIELLVTIAILAILFVALLFFLRKPLQQAQDARTKKDLHDIKVAFDKYYNDNYCYPPAEWFNNADDCSSDQFAPYIKSIKCDPKTDNPYFLEYDATGCEWFKVYTNLYYPDENLYVYDGTGNTNYNYGVSSTNTAVEINPPASPSPIPSPSTSPSPSPTSEIRFYCQSLTNCTGYDTSEETHTPNYDNNQCDYVCVPPPL